MDLGVSGGEVDEGSGRDESLEETREGEGSVGEE